MKLLITVCGLLLSTSLLATSSFTTMSYNVENLFDAQHDNSKEDWSYLPQDSKLNNDDIIRYCKEQSGYNRDFCFNVDWNAENVQTKLEQISKVILSFNHGMGADILFLTEVENLHVLNALMLTLNAHLPESSQYQHAILIEGKDVRGIDPGIITRFEVTDSKSHHIDMSDVTPNYETRSILEVHVKIDDKKIALFANHWPSQAHDDKARLEASEVLLSNARQAAKDNDLVLASGDFNSLEGEHPSGIDQNILPNFYDAKQEKHDMGLPVFKGTHYYQGEWSNLDRMFVLKGHNKDIQPEWANFKIWYEDFMLQNRKNKNSVVPMRYDFFANRGFSDHFPIVMEFSL